MTTAIIKRNLILLTASTVRRIFNETLRQEESRGIIAVNGVGSNIRFDLEKLETYRADIIEMLNQLPEPFHVGFGDGWSFLNMCIDNNGEQWTDYHTDCDKLLCLGIAIGACEYTIKQRDLWRVFPGGMPYITINTNAI